jgi:hypothetical protein
LVLRFSPERPRKSVRTGMTTSLDPPPPGLQS